MDFIKKHYEKILLGVMLVGLIGVLVFMIFYIATEKSAMETESQNLVTPHRQTADRRSIPLRKIIPSSG